MFDDVVTAILEEESRHKNRDRLGSSKQVEALTITRGRSTERGSSRSHNHSRSKSRSRKNIKCYNCGKKGHVKKDCWHNKSTSETTNSQGCVAGSSGDGDVLYREAGTISEGRKELVGAWIMDSGAT